LLKAGPYKTGALTGLSYGPNAETKIKRTFKKFANI